MSSSNDENMAENKSPNKLLQDAKAAIEILLPAKFKKTTKKRAAHLKTGAAQRK